MKSPRGIGDARQDAARQGSADAVDVVGTAATVPLGQRIDLRRVIVAGAGVPVAKHGNRALSSRSGARRMCLLSLGVKIDITPEQSAAAVAEPESDSCSRQRTIGNEDVGPTRVELATRTIFNLLGPLSNPPA